MTTTKRPNTSLDHPARSHRTSLLLLAAGTLACLTAWLAGRLAAPTESAAPEPPAAGAGAEADTARPAGQAVVPPDPGPARTPVAGDEPDAASAPSFEQQVELLAELGEATAALAQADEIEDAKASDARAREAFAELMGRFADAGERGLAMLTGIPEGSALPRDGARRVVLQLVIAAECARRHDAALAAGDHARIDAFVEALLGVLLQGPAIAELGVRVLDGRPYLRLAHEPAVLDFVRQAGELDLPRQLATRLLLTLWDNLQRSGERSSAELAGLALVLLADADPSKRTAACRQLLADGRYRHVVLAWIRERRDVAVAAEVAQLAAQELPPADALAVLRELAPTVPSMPGAYMALGFRAPDVLVTAYEELLATNTHPTTRSDLIAGLAITDATKAVPAIELAMQADPAPDVRVQAMLSLTAIAAPTRGEQACLRILDDPVLGRDPGRLSAVVFALQNLEAAGLTNAVDRIGQRLRSAPLRDDSRLALEQLLTRALPGGVTSR